MHPEIRFLLSCLAVAAVFPALFYSIEALTAWHDRRQYRRAVAAKESRVRAPR